MKRFFFAALTVAALTMNNDAKAQKGFSLSAKVTPQFSFLQNEDDNDSYTLDKKSTFNASFGIGAGYNFTNRVGVGMDVLYSLQGQRYKKYGVETNQKVSYVKIPLYVSYNGDPSKTVSFIGKVGPQVSILADSHLTNKDGDDIIPDTKDHYKDATFGVMAASGVQFRLDRRTYLSTMTHFGYDFTNAEDDTYPLHSAGRAKTHNMTLGLEVGVKYFFN